MCVQVCVPEHVMKECPCTCVHVEARDQLRVSLSGPGHLGSICFLLRQRLSLTLRFDYQAEQEASGTCPFPPPGLGVTILHYRLAFQVSVGESKWVLMITQLILPAKPISPALDLQIMHVSWSL